MFRFVAVVDGVVACVGCFVVVGVFDIDVGSPFLSLLMLYFCCGC